MALEDVFQTGWGVWVNLILGNIGGTEAKLLSVSVTATMIIIGILTYIVLRYVILARFGEALPDEQKNISVNKEAQKLMLDKTSVIKRPLLEKDGTLLHIGFDAASYQKIFNL